MIVSLFAAALLAQAPATVPAVDSAAASVAAAASAAGSAIPDGQRVCVSDGVTGSRIPLRTCKTAGTWRAEGLTVGRRR